MFAGLMVVPAGSGTWMVGDALRFAIFDMETAEFLVRFRISGSMRSRDGEMITGAGAPPVSSIVFVRCGCESCVQRMIDGFLVSCSGAVVAVGFFFIVSGLLFCLRVCDKDTTRAAESFPVLMLENLKQKKISNLKKGWKYG